MSINNFKRSNVNERTLSISAPKRSSFDLSQNTCTTLSLGRLLPLHIQRFMPSSIIKGNLDLNMQMERIAAPTIGRLRLDTHAFLVYDNRVNKDIKQFYQDGISGVQKVPHFLAWTEYSRLLCGLLSQSVTDTWGDLFPSTSPDNIYKLGRAVVLGIIVNLENLIGDSTSEHYYLKDFYSAEIERLAALRDYLASYEAQHAGTLPYSFPRLIMEIMRPYIGAGSNLERLGYPKFTLYSYELNRLEYLWESAETEVGLTTILAEKISDFFKSFDGTSTWDDENVSEYPIRKDYAVWFDHFRNFQLEKRDKVLDPDLFGSGSLLSGYPVSLDRYALLFVSKYRTFARDMLTTVQTDDIWRHVYAPIFGASSIEGTVITSQEFSSSFDYQNAINAIFIGSSDSGGTPIVPFPSGLLGGVDSVSVLQHDLQVQRRAGMLEKYLMREYFTPDTYSGFMKAHYGVEPEDFVTSISQYLGGSETIVNGDQHYASMETPAVGSSAGTPRGTRTLVAGAADKGASFSYRLGGGFADLITYASLVPLVKYDVKNMHLHEINAADMPIPEFAQDSRVEVRTQDFLRGFQHDARTLGFSPRYIQYRGVLDCVHGDYLEGKRVYDFVRDWWNITNESYQKSASSSFVLSPYCMRVHIKPEQFAGLQEWDSICYGSADLQLFVDCPLPAVIDFM